MKNKEIAKTSMNLWFFLIVRYWLYFIHCNCTIFANDGMNIHIYQEINILIYLFLFGHMVFQFVSSKLYKYSIFVLLLIKWKSFQSGLDWTRRYCERWRTGFWNGFETVWRMGQNDSTSFRIRLTEKIIRCFFKVY